jgi:hypothetical protein
MPYIEDGIVWDRVTEVTGVIECEEKGHHTRTINEQIRSGKRKRMDVMITFDTIKGTIVHHRIHDFLFEMIELPPPIHKFSPEEEQLLFQIESNPVLKRELDLKVARAYTNFIDFWGHFNPIPLAVEQGLRRTYVYKDPDTGKEDLRGLGGTVDLICLIEEGKLDESKRRTPRSRDLKIIVLDWKSGTSHQSTHKTQLSTYYWMASEEILPKFLKKYDYYTWKGIPQGMDVYLGGASYKAMSFDINERLFFSTLEKYNTAEPIPLNTLSGKLATTLMQCLYCNHRSRCSVFVEMVVEVSVSDGNQESTGMDSIQVGTQPSILSE